MNRWERLPEPSPFVRWVARRGRAIVIVSLVIAALAGWLIVESLRSGPGWGLLSPVVTAVICAVQVPVSVRMAQRHLAAFEAQQAQSTDER